MNEKNLDMMGILAAVTLIDNYRRSAKICKGRSV